MRRTSCSCGATCRPGCIKSSQGATTVWERWDAILPDGSIHPGTMSPPPNMPEGSTDGEHMLSFNHYAYGAVIDFVYRVVAGIAPVPARPGYRHVVFAPRPAAGIDHASASVESAYGTVAIEWRLSDQGLVAQVDLPFGTTGEFRASLTAESSVTLDGRPSASPIEIGPGRHDIVVTSPRVAQPAGERGPRPSSVVGAR